MKRIYIFCNAGMSTSLLASKMQKLALENGLAVEVKAHSILYMKEFINHAQPDVILLGPQIRHLYEHILTEYQQYNIPILVINEEDYGKLDAQRVLKTALLRLAKKDE